MEYQALRANPITYATHGTDFSEQQVERLYRVRGVPFGQGASEALRIAHDFGESVGVGEGDVSAFFKKVFMKATTNPLVLVNCKRRLLKNLRAMSLDDEAKLSAKNVYFTDGKDGPRLYVKHKTYITL